MRRLRARIARLSRRPILVVCVGEAGLLLVAALVAWPTGLPVFGDWQWSASAVALGVAATLPMLVLPWWTSHSRWAPIVRLREVLESRLLVFFSGWPVAGLVLVSVIAGVSEEALFRAVIQGGLQEVIGPLPALVIASAVFGAFHPITGAYAVIAAGIGLYLGALWIVSGNLLAPVVAHALYDALVLVWFGREARDPGDDP